VEILAKVFREKTLVNIKVDWGKSSKLEFSTRHPLKISLKTKPRF
jgi:hypothetical protein